MSRNDQIQQIVQSFITFRKGLIKAGPKDQLNLSHAQIDAMMCIFENEAITAGDLARMLRVTPGAASQLIDTLISSQLVLREVDKMDRRITRIRVSKTGSEIQLRMKKERLKKLQSILAPLNDDELKMLAQLLQKVEKSVQENKGE